MDNQTFNAVITRDASKVQTKSNGGQYVLHTALIQDGVLKGQQVTCSRTILNKDGEEKSYVAKGEEVTLHARVVTDGNGNAKPFFEIQSKSGDVASDADILKALGAQQ